LTVVNMVDDGPALELRFIATARRLAHKIIGLTNHYFHILALTYTGTLVTANAFPAETSKGTTVRFQPSRLQMRK